MTDLLYLSRARIRAARGEALSAIAPLLVPDEKTQRPGHAHRILWLLFQEIPDAERDFLWRDDGNGKYMILSRRPPVDPLGLFALDTTAFEPTLAAGDRLAFVLRANPVVTTKRAGVKRVGGNGKARGTRVDIVIDALHRENIPAGSRGPHRDRVAAKAGVAWLEAQGDRAGFKIVRNEPEPVIGGYTQIPIERRHGRRPAGFSVLDFAGQIEITEPAAFLSKLAKGFGAAKAFGNGLMLIRRA
ncbi:MAG TPA: type I-E CRISPR-associated protein Cas6/Cse3/CasE [Hyphomicrobium sp.]|nr:type I-E CRISPR-associated protein Cas6/Cse3/CasE [Hyphomicrobium sp.]